MIITHTQAAPPAMSRSRAKLWIRTGILASRHISLSFDRLYFALILSLVIAKAVTGKVPGLTVWADVLMCVILGLMVGRLSGICLRVRDLKLRHNLR